MSQIPQSEAFSSRREIMVSLEPSMSNPFLWSIFLRQLTLIVLRSLSTELGLSSSFALLTATNISFIQEPGALLNDSILMGSFSFSTRKSITASFRRAQFFLSAYRRLSTVRVRVKLLLPISTPQHHICGQRR